jgi:hypothetical protein
MLSNSNSKENNKINLPKFINYFIILDYSFPKEPPKLLLKTNVKKIF